MKAYEVTDNRYYDCSTIVFANNRSKARVIALGTSACEYTPYINIRATRVPALDKYYRKKGEMDWDYPEDRIAMVKEANFSCSYEYDVTKEECEHCPAKKWCGRYDK